MDESAAYLFLDEGGNFDFSKNGTEFLTITCVSVRRPFPFDSELSALLYNLIEQGVNIECFHASEDKQATRNLVFNVIEHHLNSIRVDSIIVRKRKTGPSLRAPEKFYPMMLGYLLRYVFKGWHLDGANQVVVVTDRLPVANKRRSIEKAIQQTVQPMLPTGTPYRILHRQSCAFFGLQVADYCNWAIGHKWTSGDERSYARIQTAIRSEFDIFKNGTRIWY